MPTRETQQARYRGFSLSSVCWGYRDMFAQTLEALFDQGAIGDHRPEVTDRFFALMRCARAHAFDHVLREFLAALNPRTAWILDLPGIFAEVTDMGRQLAEAKLHYGVTYFRTLGQGGFGHTPAQVRALITGLHRLRTVDDNLAVAFLQGYGRLVERLSPPEVGRYLDMGIALHQQSPQSGLRFMRGDTQSAEQAIRYLTHECRLHDIRPALERLLVALVGYQVEVADLGRLDSDELIERNTRVVCLYRWLYLPAHVRAFSTAAQNRNWYWLTAVVAAGALSFDSFCRIHGHPGYATCADLVGEDVLRCNLLQLVEYARILHRIRAAWPGARPLLALGIDTVFGPPGPDGSVDRLYRDLLCGTSTAPLAAELLALAAASVNVFDTATSIDPALAQRAAAAHPQLAFAPLPTLPFLPDFSYPASVSPAPQESLVADLKRKAEGRRTHADQAPRARQQRPHSDNRTAPQGEAQPSDAVAAAFLYDEWSEPEGDYYLDYCHVHELRQETPGPAALASTAIPEDVAMLAARTRRVFELLCPQWAKEKRLPDGDTIDIDRLVDHQVLRRREPSPKVDFYQKPLRKQRDLAVLVLLDVSGSTGQETARARTIELERHAAIILGQGLSMLDDRFAVCGFSGTGREQCEFHVYKDFDDRWDRASIARILAAYPRSATRIGAALRHAGYRLSRIPARQRLIVAMTDGKPTDTDYDPATRYAQHDVRMACVENRRQGIHTFCVSTLENSRADMEIMFPGQMFAILPDIRQLPDVLPRLYIRMTT
ncbi:MAG: VWA domain-containing protein [Anaerolineae bacterium]|nr:VWA domain-containing protein [Anaerolineae bacterium]